MQDAGSIPHDGGPNESNQWTRNYGFRISNGWTMQGRRGGIRQPGRAD